MKYDLTHTYSNWLKLSTSFTSSITDRLCYDNKLSAYRPQALRQTFQQHESSSKLRVHWLVVYSSTAFTRFNFLLVQIEFHHFKARPTIKKLVVIWPKILLRTLKHINHPSIWWSFKRSVYQPEEPEKFLNKYFQRKTLHYSTYKQTTAETNYTFACGYPNKQIGKRGFLRVLHAWCISGGCRCVWSIGHANRSKLSHSFALAGCSCRHKKYEQKHNRKQVTDIEA